MFPRQHSQIEQPPHFPVQVIGKRSPFPSKLKHFNDCFAGDVFVHPSAIVDTTAVVSIKFNCASTF